jgi:hypothetical protein
LGLRVMANELHCCLLDMWWFERLSGILPVAQR